MLFYKSLPTDLDVVFIATLAYSNTDFLNCNDKMQYK